MLYFCPPTRWFILGLMASRETCTLLSEMSESLAGLPWRGGWEGDRERNRGLPGAMVRFWAAERDMAGEPGSATWSREAAEGEPSPGKRAGVAADIPKLLPPAVT